MIIKIVSEIVMILEIIFFRVFTGRTFVIEGV
jgi:hypothetical protein